MSKDTDTTKTYTMLDKKMGDVRRVRASNPKDAARQWCKAFGEKQIREETVNEWPLPTED